MLFLEFLCFWTVFGNNNMGFSLNQRPANSYCDANSTISILQYLNSFLIIFWTQGRNQKLGSSCCISPQERRWKQNAQQLMARHCQLKRPSNVVVQWSHQKIQQLENTTLMNNITLGLPALLKIYYVLTSCWKKFCCQNNLIYLIQMYAERIFRRNISYPSRFCD